MSRRIEIELTSERPDGTWSWRAAGAKQPKGDLLSSVLPDGSKVGDVVRADADFTIDGIEILAVLPPKGPRKEPEFLAVVGTRQDEPLVTTTLVEKGGRSRDGDGRGRGRGRDDKRGKDRNRDGRPGGDKPRSDRPRGDSSRPERSRGPRPDPVPERPKPKRLRAGRAHRSAVLDTLPVEHRPIAEQVIRGGIPAVREAILKQNTEAKAENRPEIPADQLIVLAEQLLPKLRAAEWRDRAEAAVADLDELDLRDLRSVIVAADGVARDEESLALKDQIQAGLLRRIEEEQSMWIADMAANLDAGRFVRALRLSSRPPKAGSPLPVDISSRLITAVSEGLTPTVNQDLWAATVDALAFSPVRNSVVPAGRPEEPSAALLDALRRVGDRLPKFVELFGLDPSEVSSASRKRGRGAPRGGKSAKGSDSKGGSKGKSKESGAPDAKSEKSEKGAKAGKDEAQADAAAKSAENDESVKTGVPADETTAEAPVEVEAPAEAEAPAESGKPEAGADEQVKADGSAEPEVAEEKSDSSDGADTAAASGSDEAETAAVAEESGEEAE